jgi:hypothetical protein
VNQIGSGIPVLKFGNLKPQEAYCRVLCNVVADKLSGLQFHDKKDVEGKKPKGSNGTEVTGEEGTGRRRSGTGRGRVVV